MSRDRKTGVTRRDFVRMGLQGAALAAAGGVLAAGLGESGDGRATKRRARRAAAAPRRGPQRILILGGTGFLGPHLVEDAQARGHVVTLFNRGKTNPHLFPDVEKLHGDRDGDLKSLGGRQWDAVIDTSGYVPRIVRASAELLAPAVSQYVFISTISVYADTSVPGMDEDAALAQLPDPKTEEVQEHYGALKAASERAAEAAMPGRVTVVRPGLIVGPGDPTDRFTYWPVRVQRGGEVLAPGSPSDPVQVIDARDLAAFCNHAAEKGHVGVFNATGPHGAGRGEDVLGIGDILDASRAASGSQARFTWVPTDFLAAHEVSPWSDMPAWVPPTGDSAGFSRVSVARAVAKGLRFRPIGLTCADTLEWWATLPEQRRAKLRAGISPERETEVLAAWHARRSGTVAR